MAHIVIEIQSLSIPTPEPEGGPICYSCALYASPDGMCVPFAAYADYDDLVSTINTNIKNAAIAAAALENITVGELDKKTLIGGAVGL